MRGRINSKAISLTLYVTQRVTKAPDQLRHPIGLLSNQQKHYDMGVNKFSKQIAK